MRPDRLVWRTCRPGGLTRPDGSGYLDAVPHRSRAGRSPTPALLAGLLLTLAAVAAYSYYVSRQMSGLRALQTDLVDRNRRGSLQLLRIQNNLNLLGLAMRDMLDEERPYPTAAWGGPLGRIREDLDDALAREAALVVEGRPTGERERLAVSLDEFWGAVDRMLAVAAGGRDAEAREDVRWSLQARQASLSATVSRLLIENNAYEEEAAGQVQAIYDRVEREAYWFVAGTLVLIAGTGLLLIRANRRVFTEMAVLSDRRRELAQQLIATRESTLKHLSRELHDELGQILTAMGSMLTRAEKRTGDATLAADLREVGEVAQSMLDTVRGLSQSLHPSILDEAGLDAAVDWYLSTVGKSLGLTVSFERQGTPVPVDGTFAIHVYRVLQEALSNVARHAGTDRVSVRFSYQPDAIVLEVEDRGTGLSSGPSRRGLGLVAMRERAELVGGRLDFERPEGGGTRVRLSVPLDRAEAHGD